LLEWGHALSARADRAGLPVEEKIEREGREREPAEQRERSIE
jgi:hypothetical protein